jgi:glycosyltransferase involved in cell wall biosynthesis
VKVALISADNGVGLTRDARILTELLQSAGHEVWFSDWIHGRFLKADINIHLELVSHHAFKYANKNILIPNPEWFENAWLPLLKNFDTVFAKTRETEKVFKALHPDVTYTGFTSFDRYIEDVEKQFVMYHFKGKSPLKGTHEAVRAAEIAGVKLYVHTFDSKISDYDFQILQNKALIHVCPSNYEGFGHYINEAKSCGAFVITVNHPPMNELVNSSFAAAAGIGSVFRAKQALCCRADVYSLAAVMRTINKTDKEVLIQLGKKARQDYLKNDAEFKKVFLQKITE